MLAFRIIVQYPNHLRMAKRRPHTFASQRDLFVRALLDSVL